MSERTCTGEALNLRLRRNAGSRTLALGARGDDVRQIQERLLALGYDPGCADGRFGYLTHDAVMAFQRDFGLRVDGIAGPKVFALLRESSLPPRRQVYVLQAGEDIADAARALGVSAELLRHMNRLSPRAKGYPGQRLVCRSHYVLAACPCEDRALRALQRVVHHLSAVAVTCAAVNKGQVEAQAVPDPWLELTRRSGLQMWVTAAPTWQINGCAEDEADVALLLGRKRLQKAAIAALLDLAQTVKAGVWLDLGRVCWGDGPRLVRLAQSLRDRLDEMRLPLMVSLPLPEGRARWRWWLTDLDYAHIGRVAHRLVLAGHVPVGLGTFDMFARQVAAVLAMVPAWKVLLGLGLRAEERTARGDLVGAMSYQRAVTMSYLAGVRPKWDAGRRLLRSSLPAAPSTGAGDGNAAGERVLWLPGKDAMAERLALLHRLNMAGVALWPVGEEDARLWDVLPRHLKPERTGV